jgi:ribosome-associated heat shock protein Hsp15
MAQELQSRSMNFAEFVRQHVFNNTIHKMSESQRLDKWLWAARFYKTRALAAKKVSGGKVKLNGLRTKPARAVVPGDRIEINKVSMTYSVVVQSLSTSRGPASKAQLLYDETEESRKLRSRRAQQARIARQSLPCSKGRPGKHERRRLLQHKGKL